MIKQHMVKQEMQCYIIKQPLQNYRNYDYNNESIYESTSKTI